MAGSDDREEESDEGASGAGYIFDCDENGHIIVPESVVKPEAPAAKPEDPAVKHEDPAVLHFKGQFSEIE